MGSQGLAFLTDVGLEMMAVTIGIAEALKDNMQKENSRLLKRKP